MISDTLSESVNEIDRYLNDPVFKDVYKGDLRDRIVAIRDQMHALRVELDTPPPLDFPRINQLQSIKDFQAKGRVLREPPPMEQMEVAGKMSIDETNLMINKRTGALGFQFKVSFKPETGE